MENQWHDKAKSKWDDTADSWHSRTTSMWEKGSRKDIIPFFTKHISAESHVVDLGCGDGYGSYLLYKNGYSVVGMDLSDQMVSLAKKNETEGLSFLQGDLAALPFQNYQFNAAMAINSLEWTKDPLHSLREIHRILHPDGSLLLGILGPTAHPRSNSLPRLRGEEVICNTMMPWECKQLAEEEGFTLKGEAWVWKESVPKQVREMDMPAELKQALTFMTLLLFQKGVIGNG
ncbi:class I SAM-dependent methyltransferase [Bacillus sp. 2205SS5-2]|uniref:class I SAM-dependent methyltransferase n=1 Tax=Bacillus sp. 2205SS5-2 TaxID=3109031 RepID=UPI00300645B8